MIEISAVKFKQLTKYDISKYFDDVSDFFKSGYPAIVSFYNGRISSVKTEYIDKHVYLLKESEKISEQFKNNNQKLTTVDFWELFEFFEDIRTKLQTISKLSKYLRSSRTDYNFSTGFAHSYTTSNEQTLEQVSSNILNDKDSDNDWLKISMSNDLTEVEYDIDGGDDIILYREKFVQNFVTSVIDNMVGEKIYGLDIQRKLEFLNDDLKVLPYKETVFQTVEILSNLRKGDIPEFSYIGVNQKLYVGSNIANLAYSALIRELNRVFQTDNLFINFKVLEIKIEQDTYILKFQVETKYKMLIESTTVVK